MREGTLTPGQSLPTVRGLALDLQVSPTTVSAAYRALQGRGVLVGEGRRGTRVSQRPPLAVSPAPALPPGARDLAVGNPDLALLPPLGPLLSGFEPEQRLYGGDISDPQLIRLARRDFERDGIPAEHLTVVGGALDGIERVLQAHLRPGDRVAIEDPGFTAVLDLLAALGLVPVPVGIDDSGLLPAALEQACRSQIAALVLTPRAQNPSGAALDKPRARELRQLLRRYPDVIVIEDDHAGFVSGAPAISLCHSKTRRWAHVRSVSKALGPDLRVALLAADELTVSRVEGRQVLGIRWVSHVLQQIVVRLWKDRDVSRRLKSAEQTYSRRRDALLKALRAKGIEAHGRSGLNVWVPVPDEGRVVQGLLDAGWAVAAGDRFRSRSQPAIRITCATLEPDEAVDLAADLESLLKPSRRTLSS